MMTFLTKRKHPKIYETHFFFSSTMPLPKVRVLVEKIKNLLDIHFTRAYNLILNANPLKLSLDTFST